MVLTSLRITAQPYPNTGDHSVCHGATEPYGVTNTPGSSYAWQIIPVTGGNGTIAGTGSSINVTWTTVGTCTLMVTETSSSGCVGLPVSILVTVHPIPDVVATPASQVICSEGTTGISLSGGVPGTTYAWTAVVSPAGSITGASAGTGDLIAQTLLNTTPAPATVTYTITPTANACVGPPIDVVITVNPTPVAVATPPAQTLCSDGTSSIGLSSTTAATTYAWTVSANPAGSITGASAGSGDNIAQTLHNTTPDPATETYTITPTANSCPGVPITVPVLVNPTPVVVATPASQTICSEATTGISLSSTTGTTTYAWTVSVSPAASVTGASAGSGPSIAQALTNVTPDIATVTYVITPTANGCPGLPISVTITVNPTPVVVATPPSQTICSEGTTNVALSSTTPGTTFGWTISVSPALSITGASAGSGDLIAQTLTNVTPDPATVTYTITPTANGCVGIPITMVVTVNPTPNAVATPPSQAICSNTSTNIALSGATAGTTYSWTIGIVPVASVTGASAGNGDLISQVLLNPTTDPGIVTYTITPSANGCAGIPITVAETVNPLPIPVIAGPTPVCQNTTGNVYTTEAGMSNYVWTVTGGTITAGAGSNNITVTWNTVGTGSVTVTYTDPNGCNPVTPTVFPVLVHPLPVPVISGPTPVCVFTSANVYATEAGMTGYTWTITGGSITSGSTTDSINVTWNVVGPQSITVTYTNPNGCVPTIPTPYPVLINPLPVTSGIFHN